jgi:transposase InsO family protein
MSKRQAVILSVTLEGLTQAHTALRFGVSESYVSRLLARFRLEGEAAYEPRSRRPLSSPTATPDKTVGLIVDLRVQLVGKGLDGGPATIVWHLAQHHGIKVSIATVRRRLLDAGLIVAEPKKRPRSSYIRFEAELPNETWQADFTHWRLADDTDIEVLSWIDDHSRYALSVTAHQRVTGPIVRGTFLETGAAQGFPASVLTDNGMVFTTRFAGGRGGRNHLETTLVELGITQKHSRPNHPTTCGKVERFHQTTKLWLAAQPPANDLDELRDQLDAFTDEYNHRRPHRSVGRATPAAAYLRLPKAGPVGSDVGAHHRVRHDKVHNGGVVTLRHDGRLHHIGVGRAHAGKAIVLLVVDLDVRIVDVATGELLRALTLDPNLDYQRQK